ncbi:hypothetical protein JFK97_06885 [Chromobacterium phragmitis]|uniref:gp53-like domain-containing protein n=1 Tax=Chromobacterium amazonense TaxID=1382803 RepID=UPI0021B75DB2|nr:hypothetical protein [Chromobacterium amazonense]MBM2884113.1 hypothetical protein [Chromobacterium amazonense]
MDRQIVYPGQILPETTLLQMTKDGMVGLGKLAAAIFGNGPVVNGLAVTPTNPASLQVTVAPGEIYSLQNIDNSMFSTLLADQNHQIVKQGILLDPVQLTLTAPGNSGQSIAYLIEASYQDQDVNPAVLPYYNSANPNQQWAGPQNNGQAQNTARKGAILVQAKAGVASSNPTPPAPDSGFVGLYVVTVGFGQTQITAANIQQYSGAPLIPNVGLLQAMQSGSLSFGMDVGTANNYVVNLTPAQTLRQEGEVIRFKAKNTNTGASTLNDGLGVVPLVGLAHLALQGGEIQPGGEVWVQWNSTVGTGSYVLLFCTGANLQVPPGTQSRHAVQLGQVVTSSSDSAFADSSGNPASTSWVRNAMSAIANAAGFIFVANSGNGIFKFPSWLGGFVIQWGQGSGTSSDVVVTYPVPFPTACIQIIASSGYTPGSGSVGYVATQGASNQPSRTTFTARTNASGLAWNWLAIGY